MMMEDGKELFRMGSDDPYITVQAAKRPPIFPSRRIIIHVGLPVLALMAIVILEKFPLYGNFAKVPSRIPACYTV
jgi:hypothetical protein